MSRKKITPQMVFDAAWQAFIVENKPPAVVMDNETTSCTYNDGRGNKCSFGLVMPAKLALSIGSNIAITTVMTDHPELFNMPTWMVLAQRMGTQDVLVADTLQGALHDGLVDFNKLTWNLSLEDRKNVYRTIAEKYGFTIPKGKKNDSSDV